MTPVMIPVVIPNMHPFKIPVMNRIMILGMTPVLISN